MSISARASAAVRPQQPRQTTCPCCDYTWEPGRPRSLPQHRRFFAIVKQAFDNWPESHDRQFASSDECRRWLVAKAGYRDTVLDVPLVAVRPDVIITIVSAALQACNPGAFAAVKGGRLLVVRAKSIKFSSMRPQEFGALCDDVAAVVERETGIVVDEALQSA